MIPTKHPPKKNTKKYSHAGTRTRVSALRGPYPNHLDYMGLDECSQQFCSIISNNEPSRSIGVFCNPTDI